MPTVRKGNWDFAKAILMFLVIYGHVCPAISGDTYTEQWCALTRVTGLFVMPLFFFISGYFQTIILNSQDILRKYKKTFLRVGVPLMSWGGLLLFIKFQELWQFTESAYFSKHIVLFVKNGIIDVANFYWFLSALLLCITLGTLLSWVNTKCSKWGTALLLISLTLFTSFRIDLFHFSFVWFYYGCGMLYKFYKSQLKETMGKKKSVWIMMVVSLACIVIGIFFYPKYTFYYTSNQVSQTSIGFILLRYLLSLIASICALYWVFKLYEKYEGRSFVTYLTKTGQDTLFLYCSHVLFLSYTLKTMVDGFYGTNGLLYEFPMIKYYLVAPIVSVVLFYLLYSLAFCLKRISFFRVLFLGLPAK